jgi:hypothetical protein
MKVMIVEDEGLMLVAAEEGAILADRSGPNR